MLFRHIPGAEVVSLGVLSTPNKYGLTTGVKANRINGLKVG